MSVNPALVPILIESHKNFLIRYTRIMLERFFRSLYAEQGELIKKKLTDRDQLDLFIQELMKIRIWPKDTIQYATKQLENELKVLKPEFKLGSELKAFLTSHMCVAVDENSTCSMSILVSPEHIRDFIYDLLCNSSDILVKIPDAVTPAGDFLRKRHALDYLFHTAIENTLLDFVQRYRHNIEESLGSGHVINPSTNDDDDEKPEIDMTSMGALPPIDETMNAASGVFVEQDDDGREEEKEEDTQNETEGEREEDEEEYSSKRDEETEEERDERHKREDRDINWANDAASNNDNRIRFNSEVEIQPFERDDPPKRSLLKSFHSPLIDESRTHNRGS